MLSLCIQIRYEWIEYKLQYEDSQKWCLKHVGDFSAKYFFPSCNLYCHFTQPICDLFQNVTLECGLYTVFTLKNNSLLVYLKNVVFI
jgi:hypothetical protein